MMCGTPSELHSRGLLWSRWVAESVWSYFSHRPAELVFLRLAKTVWSRNPKKAESEVRGLVTGESAYASLRLGGSCRVRRPATAREPDRRVKGGRKMKMTKR